MKELKVFRDWMDWRKGKEDKETPPQDKLMSEDGVAVCRWLCKFFTEVRKGYGLEYSPMQKPIMPVRRIALLR